MSSREMKRLRAVCPSDLEPIAERLIREGWTYGEAHAQLVDALQQKKAESIARAFNSLGQ